MDGFGESETRRGLSTPEAVIGFANTLNPSSGPTLWDLLTSHFSFLLSLILRILREFRAQP
jgi:hypothetical protein